MEKRRVIEWEEKRPIAQLQCLGAPPVAMSHTRGQPWQCLFNQHWQSHSQSADNSFMVYPYLYDLNIQVIVIHSDSSLKRPLSKPLGQLSSFWKEHNLYLNWNCPPLQPVRDLRPIQEILKIVSGRQGQWDPEGCAARLKCVIIN